MKIILLPFYILLYTFSFFTVIIAAVIYMLTVELPKKFKWWPYNIIKPRDKSFDEWFDRHLKDIEKSWDRFDDRVRKKFNLHD